MLSGAVGTKCGYIFNWTALVAPAARAAGAAGLALHIGMCGDIAFVHHAEATGDHATNGLTRFGMLREGVVLHALADFEAADRFGNGFVDVGWHGANSTEK
jgi:hypothetical protein